MRADVRQGHTSDSSSGRNDPPQEIRAFAQDASRNAQAANLFRSNLLVGFFSFDKCPFTNFTFVLVHQVGITSHVAVFLDLLQYIFEERCHFPLILYASQPQYAGLGVPAGMLTSRKTSNSSKSPSTWRSRARRRHDTAPQRGATS